MYHTGTVLSMYKIKMGYKIILHDIFLRNSGKGVYGMIIYGLHTGIVKKFTRQYLHINLMTIHTRTVRYRIPRTLPLSKKRHSIFHNAT